MFPPETTRFPILSHLCVAFSLVRRPLDRGQGSVEAPPPTPPFPLPRFHSASVGLIFLLGGQVISIWGRQSACFYLPAVGLDLFRDVNFLLRNLMSPRLLYPLPPSISIMHPTS